MVRPVNEDADARPAVSPEIEVRLDEHGAGVVGELCLRLVREAKLVIGEVIEKRELEGGAGSIRSRSQAIWSS